MEERTDSYRKKRSMVWIDVKRRQQNASNGVRKEDRNINPTGRSEWDGKTKLQNIMRRLKMGDNTDWDVLCFNPLGHSDGHYTSSN